MILERLEHHNQKLISQQEFFKRLVILIGFSIAGLWWKVETTPPSEPENTVSEMPDE